MVLEKFEGVPQEFIEAVAEQEQKIHELKAELERVKQKSNFFLEIIEYISFHDINWDNYFKDRLKEFEEE